MPASRPVLAKGATISRTRILTDAYYGNAKVLRALGRMAPEKAAAYFAGVAKDWPNAWRGSLKA